MVIKNVGAVRGSSLIITRDHVIDSKTELNQTRGGIIDSCIRVWRSNSLTGGRNRTRPLIAPKRRWLHMPSEISTEGKVK